MQTPDGRYVITYNGEIYNFQELRAELEARGYRFHSRTDTEVLLHAFAAWGVDALKRFNGMFAFALWDRRERTSDARPRSLRHQAALLLAGTARSFCSLRGQGLSASSRISAGRDRSGGLARVFHVPEFLHDRTLLKGVRTASGRLLSHAARPIPPPARCRSRFAIGTFASRSRANARSEADYLRRARSPVPAGRQPPARMRRRRRRLSVRRHGFGIDHRDRREVAQSHAHLHVRLRPQLGVRHRAWISTSAQPRNACRTPSRPSTTRWCSRPATWSACCRSSPGISRSRASGRAIRTSTPRSSRASSSRSCFGHRRRRAVRRLSVALLPGRRQRRLRALHRQVLTSSGSA